MIGGGSGGERVKGIDSKRLLTPPRASAHVIGGGAKGVGVIPTLDMRTITADRTIKLEGNTNRGGGKGVCHGLMPFSFLFDMKFRPVPIRNEVGQLKVLVPTPS